jgi:hypothetical protein
LLELDFIAQGFREALNASPLPNNGYIDPTIVGTRNRSSCHNTTRRTNKFCAQDVLRGNPELEEISNDIFVSNYDNVCIVFKERTLLGYFMSRVSHEYIIKT